MLDEIIQAAIATEPDMTIVEQRDGMTGKLGAYTRRRRIDVIIFTAGDEDFADHKIMGLLHANPRLSLLAMDGPGDQGTLHHLVPTKDDIGRLAQTSLTAAIRAGAQLRLG
jgi:hypothetical protein